MIFSLFFSSNCNIVFFLFPEKKKKKKTSYLLHCGRWSVNTVAKEMEAMLHRVQLAIL
jgi:hypothetical protein